MKKKLNKIKLMLVIKNRSSLWLAEQLGKDKSTVSRWCTNDMQPSLETIFKIAEILEVSPHELIADS